MILFLLKARFSKKTEEGGKGEGGGEKARTSWRAAPVRVRSGGGGGVAGTCSSGGGRAPGRVQSGGDRELLNEMESEWRAYRQRGWAVTRLHPWAENCVEPNQPNPSPT
jgi:hypothetical protein